MKASITVLFGMGIGFFSAHTLFATSWIALLLWGVAGVGLGLFLIKEPKESLWTGGIFGFALSLTFLLSVFGGSPDKLPGYLVLALGLSVVGIIGGIASAFLGFFLKSFIKK